MTLITDTARARHIEEIIEKKRKKKASHSRLLRSVKCAPSAEKR